MTRITADRQRLRLLRANRGFLSQPAVAAAVGIGRWRYHRIESGRLIATPDERRAIARFFKVAIGFVFPELDDGPRRRPGARGAYV